MKSPGWVSFSKIPPTRAAASSTASGRCSSNQRSTACWSRRSTVSRLAVRIRHFSSTNRRTSAEPTMPRWPATKMRRPPSANMDRRAMLSTAPRRRRTSSGVDKPGLAHRHLAPREVDVVLNHHLNQLFEINPRFPAEYLARLCRISTQRVDLSWPEIAPIDLDVAPPVEPGCRERDLDEFAHAVRLSGGNDIVVGFRLPQHEPHRLDIIAGKAPIAPGIEVSQVKFVLKTLGNATDCSGHLPCDEGLAATRTFMVE